MADPATVTAAEVEARLRELADPSQVELIAKRVARDQVIGVRMKHTFDLARELRRVDLGSVTACLRSPWFEVRMVAVSILDAQARVAEPGSAHRTALYETYLAEHRHIDTWDLVDRAAPRVVGGHLLGRGLEPLHRLSGSSSPWERRTAVVAGFWIIRFGDPTEIVEILGRLVDDPEVVVQSAVGTAVRELRRHHPELAATFDAAHVLPPAARRAAAVGRS